MPNGDDIYYAADGMTDKTDTWVMEDGTMEGTLKQTQEDYPASNYFIMCFIAVLFAVQVITNPDAKTIRPLVLRTWTWYSMVTYMWIHLDLIHAIESLATLWIFGRYIAQKMRPAMYVGLYVLLGVIAAATHILFDGRPAVGASGAIMGILGMHAVICFSRFGKFEPFLMLLWFSLSLFLGIEHLGPSAHMAHIGGFMAGLAIACILIIGDWVDTSDTHPAILRLLQGHRYSLAQAEA